MKSKSPSFSRCVCVRFALACALISILVSLFGCENAVREKSRAPLSQAQTIAGLGADGKAGFLDPFGVACATDGDVFVTDGERGELWRIAPNGDAKVIASNLNTPSAVAVAPDNSLIVAETGAHRIVRVDASNGSVKTIAGVPGLSGFRDGDAAQSLFDAPIGVAVGVVDGKDETIFVADTYNDRIRAIDKRGEVRTVAGGEQGFADGAKDAARFDTPCGVAFENPNVLIVADTGNNRLRRVSLEANSFGAVTTLAGNGDARESDDASNVSFNEPTSVAIDGEGKIYVADAAGGAIRVLQFGAREQTRNENANASAAQQETSSQASPSPSSHSSSPQPSPSTSPQSSNVIVKTLTGGAGLADGALEKARVLRPSGIAVASDGTVIFADTGNGLVRAIVAEGNECGITLSAEQADRLKRSDPNGFRRAAPARWSYDPPQRAREIAATFGEVRGFVEPGKEAHFHNGLDVPGALGETVRAVRAERVMRPLSVNDVGTARERIRLPTLGYIHVRIGRDAAEKNLDERKFVLRRDEKGRVVNVRVRRGTTFNAGDAIGVLNTQYHVHLIAGRAGSEMNALAALELPGVKDTTAPTIERIQFYDRDWRELKTDEKSGAQFKKTSATQTYQKARVTLSGDVRVVVTAYDQMDDNLARRRLGLYRLGYQILKTDGAPAPGFDEPRWTISFETLPEGGDEAVRLVYAPGSQAGYSPQAVFAYIVTNIARDRHAREDFWQTSQLPSGDYTVRVTALDFFGNRTTRDSFVHVAGNAK